MDELAIRGLHASVNGKEILKGVDLVVRRGEVHAVMGPNGSGKSTLASVIMGHPAYVVDFGDILLDGKSILGLSPDERCRAGLFLSFQYPLEIPGVGLSSFMRTAYNFARPEGERLSPVKFRELLAREMAGLGVPAEFIDRNVNEGFSGGEKKRCEILQMSLLRPKYAVLDETDSGLDVDALRVVSEGARRAAAVNNSGVLLITHYQRILKYVKPDFVHVFVGGRIVESGGPELAVELESTGYAKFTRLKLLE